MVVDFVYFGKRKNRIRVLQTHGKSADRGCTQLRFSWRKVTADMMCPPSSLHSVPRGWQFWCQRLPRIPVLIDFCDVRGQTSFLSMKWPPQQVQSSLLSQFCSAKCHTQSRTMAAQFQEQLFSPSNKFLTWSNCSFSSEGAPFWSSFSLICTSK